MKEIVVISGKGGTGKTSVTASFAVLAKSPVIADCDVDASDLHLILSPRIQQRSEFISGHEAVIRQEDCIQCGGGLAHCRYGAVMMDGKSAGEATFTIDPNLCEGCGVCVRFCPVNAIDFNERHCGEWMISETRNGPMVHARLGIAAENSGKLVSIVRREARRIAEEQNRELIIIDGPPGIGCPVIASLTGTTLAVVITEPTVSGEHDLERILKLIKHFRISCVVCINKWDLNPEITEIIEKKAQHMGAFVGGRIHYDASVTTAQMNECAVVETESQAATDIRKIWDLISQ